MAQDNNNADNPTRREFMQRAGKKLFQVSSALGAGAIAKDWNLRNDRRETERAIGKDAIDPEAEALSKIDSLMMGAAAGVVAYGAAGMAADKLLDAADKIDRKDKGPSR